MNVVADRKPMSNCLAVRSLRDVSEMAEWLGEPDLAKQWRTIADSIGDAINRYLWNDKKQAYTDCLKDGEQSRVFSQQTQTMAYISGVASGKRADRALELIRNPPEEFVKAGTPFFEFFILEAYQRDCDEQALIAAMLKKWDPDYWFNNGQN